MLHGQYKQHGCLCTSLSNQTFSSSVHHSATRPSLAMKFVAILLLPSLISVLIVDCHNFHDEPGGQNPLDEAQQTSETVDGPQNPDSVGEAENKPWKETPLTVTEIKEPQKKKGEGQRKSGLRGKKKGGSKCKVTIGCSLLGGSCGVKANVCSGRVSDYGCKGKGCKCCIPRSEIENSIDNITIQLQAVQEKLIQLESNNVHLVNNFTVANSQLDSKLESKLELIINNFTVTNSQQDSKLESKLELIINNFTVTNSQLDSKLESKLELITNNFTVVNSQQDSKLESKLELITNNFTVANSQQDSKLESKLELITNNFTVVKSQLDSKLQLIQSNLTALDSEMEDIQDLLDERQCPDNFTRPDARQCPGGFFKIGNQCYRMYYDTYRTWNQSKEKCEDEGYVMATKPNDAITLRNYTVEQFGNGWVWMGARGDGVVFRYVRTDDHISNTDPLWWPGYPGSRVTTSHCLGLLSHSYNVNRYPTQPFDSTSCTSRLWTLCEYLME